MIPMTKHREVSTGGVVDSTSLRISFKNQEKIKAMLREGIYSDKVLAPIREYSSNAWDAHRMSGKGDRPIRVVIPTSESPMLVVEDYGPGLSHEEVFSTFTDYGESTKEGTNDAVGQLGLGSKSGYAYSDTFIVISRHGGKKRTYVAKLDEDEKDSFDLLLEEDWDGETGLTIQIAVRKEDINEFERKAKEFFQFFSPRPDTNIELPAVPPIRSKLQHGIIFEEGQYDYYRTKTSSWVAVMGCVPYKIDLDQLKDGDGTSLISDVFRRASGLLEFPVGAIQFNISREGLKYSKVTKAALVAKFGELLDEYVTVMLAEIETGDSTNWEKRIKAQQLRHLGFTEKEIGDWATEEFKLEGTVTFDFERQLRVRPNTSLVRQNGPADRSIWNYTRDSHNQILVRPRAKMKFLEDGETQVPVTPAEYYTWDEIEQELQRVIQDNKLDGIPVVDLSALPYYAPPPRPVKEKVRRPSGPKNLKHVKRVFRLIDPPRSVNKLSDHWEAADITPSKEDVYVIIREFQAVSGESVPHLRTKDLELAKIFGITLPPVYGYKTTDRYPVDHDKVTGTPYAEWRRKFHTSLRQHHTVKRLIENYQWLRVPLPYKAGSSSYSAAVIRDLARAFGEGHIIPTLFTKAIAVKERGLNYELEGRRIKILEEYEILPKGYVSEAEQMLKTIKEKYPLLDGADLRVLWAKSRARHWRQYIRLVDNKQRSTP